MLSYLRDPNQELPAEKQADSDPHCQQNPRRSTRNGPFLQLDGLFRPVDQGASAQDSKRRRSREQVLESLRGPYLEENHRDDNPGNE